MSALKAFRIFAIFFVLINNSGADQKTLKSKDICAIRTIEKWFQQPATGAKWVWFFSEEPAWLSYLTSTLNISGVIVSSGSYYAVHVTCDDRTGEVSEIVGLVKFPKGQKPVDRTLRYSDGVLSDVASAFGYAILKNVENTTNRTVGFALSNEPGYQSDKSLVCRPHSKWGAEKFVFKCSFSLDLYRRRTIRGRSVTRDSPPLRLAPCKDIEVLVEADQAPVPNQKQMLKCIRSVFPGSSFDPSKSIPVCHGGGH